MIRRVFSIQRFLPNFGLGCQSIRFFATKSYFDCDDHDREEIIQRTKYRKRNGEHTVSLRDVKIPHSQIRQFIKLVHPDRFQVFINNINNKDILYRTDQLKMMQQVNETNLSTLNSILEFSRKHSKMIHSHSNTKNVINDRQMTQNSPNPANFEFYIDKSMDIDKSTSMDKKGTYFEHIEAKFDCKVIRPFISEFYKTLNKTLNKLFRACHIDIDIDIDIDECVIKKFSDLEIDKAMKLANNGDEYSQNIINDVMNKHLSEETQQKNKLYGINVIKYKLENKKIYFASTLNKQHIEAIMSTLYKVSGEFAIDLVFDLWIDVPIIVCQQERECLKCPNYVVAIPWYCDYEEFVLYIQDQIVSISQNYNNYKIHKTPDY